jgi:hypothetical protein
MTRIEEAVREWWGPRCSGFEPECGACQAWAEVDERAEKAEASLFHWKGEVLKERGRAEHKSELAAENLRRAEKAEAAISRVEALCDVALGIARLLELGATRVTVNAVRAALRGES